MRTILFLLLMASTTVQAQHFRHSYKKTILSIMNQQARDWSSGNPEAFMQAYWKNDSLIFITSKGITYGWQNMLDRYKMAYPNSESMGQLLFSELYFKRMNINTVWLRGKWELLRNEDNLNGYFTLIWKKKHGEWVIVSDHTS